jgi:tetratricopeptide (TPR) repeat protein
VSLDLDIARLWTSPMADAAVRRFEARWTDDIVERRTPGPDPARRQAYWALKADLKTAWIRNDLKSVAGYGLILHRGRTLNDGARAQLAVAMLAQDRFAEAREVLAMSGEDSHEHWLKLAVALAGLAAFHEARGAIAEARARLEPVGEAEAPEVVGELGRRRWPLDVTLGSRAARHEALLQIQAGRADLAAARLNAFARRRLEQLEQAIEAAASAPASPPASWAELQDQAAARLLFGLALPAAERLRTGLETTRPASPGEIGRALHLANAIAAGLPGARQADLLRAVRGLFAADADGAFLDLGARVLAGETPWPQLVATEPRPRHQVQIFLATLFARSGRPEPAIRLLGELVQGRKDRQALRRELAVCCGAETMGRLRPEPRPRPGPRRIFDLFPYNGELEVLKVKLHEMAPWVDRFIIVEAAETFTGRPKPIHLPGQSAEIAEFLPKITHVVVTRFPEHAASAWAREYHQRDEAVAALKDICAPDDLVLLSDADEVVDRRCLEGFQGGPAVLKKLQCRYFFNYCWTAATGRQTGNLILMPAGRLRDFGPSAARALLPAPLEPNRLERAGWHFSSVGDVAAITHKLSSYSHQENVRPDSAAHTAAALARIRAGELESGWERCDLGDLPAYIRENRERLAPLIL